MSFTIAAVRMGHSGEVPSRNLVGNGFIQENFGISERIIALFALILAPFHTKEWRNRQCSILTKGSVVQLTTPSAPRKFIEIVGNLSETSRIIIRVKHAVGDVLYLIPSEECPKGKVFIITRQDSLASLDIQQLRSFYKSGAPDELEHLIANWDQQRAYLNRVELERQLEILRQFPS